VYVERTTSTSSCPWRGRDEDEDEEDEEEEAKLEGGLLRKAFRSWAEPW